MALAHEKVHLDGGGVTPARRIRHKRAALTIAPPVTRTSAKPPFDLATIDRALRAQGLVAPERAEQLGRRSDIVGKAVAPDVRFTFPQTHELATEPQGIAGFLFKIALDPLLASRAICDKSTVISAGLSELFGPRPGSLEAVHLQKLWNSRHFGDRQDVRLPNFTTKVPPPHWPPRPSQVEKPKPYDSKLETAAFLVSRGITREADLEMILPAFSYQEYQSYQSKIHRELKITFPEIYTRFQVFWDSLTSSQREALKHVYMEQGALPSKPMAAEQLGISIDSLKDRLSGALKKLEASFPEWVPVTKNRPAYWKTLYAKRKLAYNGLFHRPTAEHVAPLFRIDPTTGIRTEIQPPIVTTRTHQESFSETKLWLAATSYWPMHNGTFSFLVNALPAVPATMRNVAQLPRVFLAKGHQASQQVPELCGH